MTDLYTRRRAIHALHRAPQADVISELTERFTFSDAERATFADKGASLVSRIRTDTRAGVMEAFLAE